MVLSKPRIVIEWTDADPPLTVAALHKLRRDYNYSLRRYEMSTKPLILASPRRMADLTCDAEKEGGLPKGPRGERRPADTIGCAVMVAKIATGEIEEAGKPSSGRARSGKAGAVARAKSLTAEERQAIAKQAAAARWR